MQTVANNATPTPVHTYVFLHRRYAVLVELVNAIRAQLDDDRLSRLDEGCAYTSRQLCGNAFWSLLALRERKLVGSCISHMANVGDLPLIRVNAFRKYPNRFCLRATDGD
jgi:hypothetical protein